MAEFPDSSQADAVVDELVGQLLNCGGVLSHMVSHAVQCQAAGLSSPDAVPIPISTHTLIVDVLGDVKLRQRYSRRDLRIAARVVRDVTEAICGEIFLVPLSDLEAFGIDRDAGGAGE
jgi:hypothetical protein